MNERSCDVLHTTGRQYIVEDIDLFIDARKDAFEKEILQK